MKKIFITFLFLIIINNNSMQKNVVLKKPSIGLYNLSSKYYLIPNNQKIKTKKSSTSRSEKTSTITHHSKATSSKELDDTQPNESGE